jgi:serine protease Do
MIGNRRASRTVMAIALGSLGFGIADVPSMAQDQATSLSAGFRRAAARLRGAVVSVRVPDGMRPGAPYVPPRVGRIGPGMLVSPGGDRIFDAEGPVVWSGVVIDSERGHILTIDRPTHGVPQLLVTFPDGAERLTRQVRRDLESGLALLIIDPKGLRLTQANWGDPDKLEPGDWLVALGQPGVGAPTMSVGIFSARRRGGGEELIETDAAIPRVGAGGALVNQNGEVIGISTPADRRADSFDRMSHAIPADRARRLAADLAQFGQVRRAYLGIQVEPVDRATAGHRGFPPGVLVASVGANTPAAEAGLRAGDVILTVGRRPIDGTAALREAVELAPIGEEMLLSLERRGQQVEVKVRPRVPANPMVPGMPPRPDPLVETRRDSYLGQPDKPDSPANRPATPDQPSRPEALPPPNPSPPRPAGTASPLAPLPHGAPAAAPER